MNTETHEPPTEPAAPPSDEQPIHLGRCAECGFTVRYQPTTGAGYTLVDTTDRLFGIGEHNRPTCPDGHGEMEIADDRLPIEQAMAQAAAQIETAATQRLPFPSPPFNYEGALHEIFEKQKAVAILEGKFNDADERRKKAKGALDDGHTELSALIETLQEREEDRLHEIARRDAAAAAGHPEDTTLVRCAWEQAHPDETCPICGDVEGAQRYFGDVLVARDAETHVDQAAAMLEQGAVAAVVDALEDAGIIVAEAIVRGWNIEQRAEVRAWAEGFVAHTQDNAVVVPARPAILGTAHVAADTVVSEAVPGDTFQCCRDCGARLATVKTGGDPEAAIETFEPYPAGTLVGTDCPGAEKEPARRIKRGKKSR